MQSIPNFDLETFRAELERQCQLAIAPISALKTEEACRAAEAKLDGIFGGLLAMSKGFSRKPWDLEFMEVARQAADKYHRRIMELRTELNPPNFTTRPGEGKGTAENTRGGL